MRPILVHPLFVLLVLLLSTASLLGEGAAEPVKFIRGDVNGDGILSQADILGVVRYFQTGSPPRCADAADFDDSGGIDITDLINLATFMYRNGLTYPAAPYRTAGIDPSPDALGCEHLVPWGLGGLRGQGGVQWVDGDQDDGQVIDFIEFFNRQVEGFPGATGIRVPIRLSNSMETDGFTICVSADPQKIWLEDIEVERNLPGRIKPEFVPLHNERLAEGYLGRSVFMDYHAPFEAKRLPRSARAIVAHLVFGLSPEAKPNERLRIFFGDIPSYSDYRPSPFNELCTESYSLRPRLDAQGLEVRVYPKSQLFLRGDSNRDQILNVTDMILILRYLFLGQHLDCLDPADADDSGNLDISDMIRLADHLFGSGMLLPPPYPNPGRDPTPDDPLGNCQ